MKNQNKVSVIVPLYNASKHLRSCLDSLRQQTLKDITIICVNDESMDQSLDLLMQYQAEDSRIKVINQKHGGRSVARNNGLKEVKTPYVMFCDSDDTYDLTMCEKMVKTVEANEVDLAVCGTNMFYEAHHEMRDSDEYYYGIRFSGKRLISDNITIDTNGSVCNKIFRTDIINKYSISFPEGLGTAEDFYFYSAYMSASKTIFFLRQKLYNYVRHEGSKMSENFDKKKLSTDDLMVAKKIFEFYNRTGFLKDHKNLFWRQWVGCFWASYRYSGRKYHKKVQQIGKEFIDKHYDDNKPSDSEIDIRVNEIRRHNGINKIKMGLKKVLVKGCSKVNRSYKQLDFIEKSLEETQWNLVCLTERINDLIEGK